MAVIFISGTGTNVGKTYFCAGLVNLLSQIVAGANIIAPTSLNIDRLINLVDKVAGEALIRRILYVKAFQTGVSSGDCDVSLVFNICPPKLFSSFGNSTVGGSLEESLRLQCFRLNIACSPHLAMQLEGTDVAQFSREKLEDYADLLNQYAEDNHLLLIIEGAGGLLTPITKEISMLDFANMLCAPIIVVSTGLLGAINDLRLSIGAIQDSRGVKSDYGNLSSEVDGKKGIGDIYFAFSCTSPFAGNANFDGSFETRNAVDSIMNDNYKMVEFFTGALFLGTMPYFG